MLCRDDNICINIISKLPAASFKCERMIFCLFLRMGEIFEEVCSKHGAILSEFFGEPDHVHLLIEFSPSTRLSDLVRALKSVS